MPARRISKEKMAEIGFFISIHNFSITKISVSLVSIKYVFSKELHLFSSALLERARKRPIITGLADFKR